MAYVEPIFYVKGDSLDSVKRRSGLATDHARFSTGGARPASVVDASAISGFQISLPTEQTSAMVYPAFDNFSKNKAFTVLLRMKGHSALNLTAHEHGVFFIAPMQRLNGMSLAFRNAVSGSMNVFWEDATTGNLLSNTNTAETGVFLANVWYDFVLTSSGLTGQPFEIYVDGTLFHTSNLSGTSDWDISEYSTINIGTKSNTALPFGPFEELAIFDVQLTDADDEITFDDDTTGKLSDLTGASRTKLLKITPSTGPAANSDVKIGVVSSEGTGTYDGTDRHTDPGETNVRDGVSYKANSTTNNKTGSLLSTTVVSGVLQATLEGGPLTGVL